MATHVKILGWLHIVLGSLGLLFGILGLAFFGGIAGMVGMSGESEDSVVAIPILGGIGAILFLIALVISLPGVIVGIGLINFKPWSRILAIILSALHLLNIPFGTALGIYGFWVLFNNATERLFASPDRALPARL
jgi:hypothetical protein